MTMASSPSFLRLLWRIFHVAMIVVGMLVVLGMGMFYTVAYCTYKSAMKEMKNVPPVWHCRLASLVEDEKVELIEVNDERFRDIYEAIIRISSPEAREAFEAQIAALRPQAPDTPIRDTSLYRRFAAEYAAEAAAPLAFDLYAGCPYGKDKTHPVLVIPGREGVYYVWYGDDIPRMLRSKN